MDVVTADQAKIAEDAGAVAVMALERVPADIRAQGGVSRMSDPDMIDGIIEAVSIPVMAKARIGHFAEAQVLQSLGVDYIDESEVLTPADYANHIDKWAFNVPFVCGATNLGEALRRLTEGAAMIRSKGEAGTGDVSNAVTHMRTIRAEIRRLGALSDRRAVRRGEGAAGAVRPGPGGRRERQAPRRPVHRRRHRDPRGRRDDDAARSRGRLRRLGDLQVRQPRASGPRRSSRRPPSTTTPTWWRRSRVDWARRWSASTSRSSRSRTGSPTAAGSSARLKIFCLFCRLKPDKSRRAVREDGSCIATRDQNHRPAGCRRGGGTPPGRGGARPTLARVRAPLTIGVLALQGDVREHLRALDTLGFATLRRTTTGRARRLRRARAPGWRVHHDGQAGPRLRPVRAPAAADRGRDAHARHLRRDDPAGRSRAGRRCRPGDPRWPRHHRAAQRLRSPGRLLRGRRRLRRPRGPRARGVHPGAVGRGARAGGRGARPSERRSRRG